MAACNRKPPWLSKAVVRTVHEIELHDAVSSGIFEDEFRDKHPCEWMKEAFMMFEEGTDAYRVEVIAKSHC